MSSILKALKRLEEESPETTGAVPILPPGAPPAGRRLPAFAGPIALAAAAAAALAGAWAFHNGPWRADREDAAPPATVRPPLPPPRAARSVSETAVAETSERHTKPAPPARTDGEAGSGAVPAPPPAAENPAAAPFVRPVSPDPEPPPAARPAIPPGLSLQAIAWSPSPADRLAVVNGRVMREGMTIEGFQVLRIARNAVTVTDGGRTVELVFGNGSGPAPVR